MTTSTEILDSAEILALRSIIVMLMNGEWPHHDVKKGKWIWVGLDYDGIPTTRLPGRDLTPDEVDALLKVEA